MSKKGGLIDSSNIGDLQNVIVPLALLGAAYYLLAKKTGDSPLAALTGGGYSGGFAVGTGAAGFGAGAGAAVVGAVDGAATVGADLISGAINAATGGHTTGSALIRNIGIMSNPVTAPAELVLANIAPVTNAASTYVDAVAAKTIKEGGAPAFAAVYSTNDRIPVTPEAKTFNTQKAAYSDLISKSKSGSTVAKVASLAKVAAVTSPLIAKDKAIVNTIASSVGSAKATATKSVSSLIAKDKAIVKSIASKFAKILDR